MIENDIRGKIISDSVFLGEGIVIEEGVEIRADHVKIEDHVYIGRNTRIFVPQIRIGEYTRINEGTFAGGTKPMQIGRHVYIGGKCRLDSRGGLDIDDGAGIGDHSQLWNHMKHGDTIRGCKWDEEFHQHIGRDAWLVGHVLCSAAYVAPRTMVMLGSTLVKDTVENHTYAGSPAKDMTDVFGAPFQEGLTTEDMGVRLIVKLVEFFKLHPEFSGQLMAFREYPRTMFDGVTYFNVTEHTYTKRNSPAEIAFIRWSGYKPTPKGYPRFILGRDSDFKPEVRS